MKNLMKRIRMKRAASKVKSRSVDPITAYKARLEIGIYTMLLDLIAKELEATKATSEQKVQTVQTVQTVQAAPTVPTTAGAQKIPAT